MRSLETKMRYAKDKQIAVKNIKDSEVAERTARHYDKLLEKYEKIYQCIANQTGVTPRPERAYVPGYRGKLPQVKPKKVKVKGSKPLATIEESGTIKMSNKEVREFYIDKVSKIKDNIDSTLPIEEQASQAFEARNRIRTEARNMMLDEETRNN